MKIICIGRNYAEHAKEMNSEVPSEPVFFMKPDTALLHPGQDFYYPEFTKDLHHEIEVVVKISKAGKHILPEFAHKYYEEIGLGIDFTARDLQAECKKKGLPWEKAKAFDHSAPIGGFLNKKEFSDLQHLQFQLTVNGEVRQAGNTKDMLFTIDQLIAHVSRYITLRVGDLLYTGTPEGVGPVKPGDHLKAVLEGKPMLDLHIR